MQKRLKNLIFLRVITLCSEKTPTHIFFHMSMNDVWIEAKIAVNIPKERYIPTM